MANSNISDFDPEIQKQVKDWISRWKGRLIREQNEAMRKENTKEKDE